MQVSRRTFINQAGVWLAGASVAGGGLLGLAGKVASGSSKVCLAPVRGEFYSAGMQAFMKKARFNDPQAAIRAVRNRRVRFALEVVPA